MPAPPVENIALRCFGYVRLHWLTILFAGTLVGAGFAFAAWTLLPTKYESYALFRVAQNPDNVGGMGDPNRGRSEFNTFVKTSAGLINTDLVYRSALRNLKLRISELPTLRKERDPVKWLNDNIVVTKNDNSEIIRMELRGDNPDDVQKIVEAMVQAFDDEVINKDRNDTSVRKTQLANAKIELEGILKRMLNKQGLDSAPALAGTAPRTLPETALRIDSNPIEQVAATIPLPPEKDETRRLQVPDFVKAIFNLENITLPDVDRRVAVSRAEIEAIKQELQKVLDEPAPEELKEAIEKADTDYLKANADAKRLSADYQQKAATVRNPAALAGLQREVETAEVEARRLLDSKVEQALRLSRKARTEGYTKEMEKLQRGIGMMENDRQLQRKRLDAMKAQLATLPAATVEQQKLEKAKSDKVITPEDLSGTKIGEIYQQVCAQLTTAELNASSPTRISTYQQPSTPSQKDPLKQYILAAVAGLLGFVAVAAGLVGYELFQRKVSSLSELRCGVHLPVVGVLPWLPDEATARDPIKRADVSEAVDKLRGYIAQSWLARGATTITVTSPLADEGKAFTAFGLASSLAQAGYKTLLVDFDLRNPSLHPYAGVVNATGVCELLRGESDFRNTIQVLPNGLHFIAAGRWSDEARLAAVGGRLESLINRLKEPFVCVVLHGHALLTVAESVEVARRSDLVLLCTLYRETHMPMLKKAQERVASMEVPYAGVVYVGATAKEAHC